jgi:hypothetical protein
VEHSQNLYSYPNNNFFCAWADSTTDIPLYGEYSSDYSRLLTGNRPDFDRPCCGIHWDLETEVYMARHRDYWSMASYVCNSIPDECFVLALTNHIVVFNNNRCANIKSRLIPIPPLQLETQSA